VSTGSGEREDLDQMGILTIEVPHADLVRDLVSALEDKWACCACEVDPRAIVFLSPYNDADFSQLVRRVQAWIADHSVGGVTFQLRGRGHIYGTT
jgi:hypothetical protein